MTPANTNVEECYSSRDDRSGAWFLALLGIIGFFDFYMKHPVRGGVKLGIVIMSVIGVILSSYDFRGILSLLGHGIEVVSIWNLFDMFRLSRGLYRDGDGYLVKKQTWDATVLFWFVIAVPIVLILFLVIAFFTGNLRIPVA